MPADGDEVEDMLQLLAWAKQRRADIQVVSSSGHKALRIPAYLFSLFILNPLDLLTT